MKTHTFLPIRRKVDIPTARGDGQAKFDDPRCGTLEVGNIGQAKFRGARDIGSGIDVGRIEMREMRDMLVTGKIGRAADIADVPHHPAILQVTAAGCLTVAA